MSSLDIEELTRRVLNDEEVTAEEYSELIASLREGRVAGAGTKKSNIPSTLPDNLDDLFK